ncbi:MAG: sigma-70 family RNA polymerase sigma factor [Clostridia bacterium]|nr:sigma-70 family RNA polymerase sigma factor [Clostridia bacterium]
MTPREFNICLRRIKTNVKAFNRLYKFYFPKIVIHIFVIYKNKNLSEDVAQEFFMKLMEMQEFNYITYPNSWVYTIAENIAKNIIAKEKKYFAEPIDNIKISVNDEYAYYLYGDYWEKLNELDEQTRKIIIMKIFEGYRYKEIADKMNLKVDTVRQKYSRGIKKLKLMSQN